MLRPAFLAMAATTEADSPSPVATDEVAGRRNATLWIALAAAALTIVADQLTKELALSGLERGEPVGLFWKLQLNLIFNTGSAFSLGAGLGPVIGVVAILISAGLLWASRSMARLRLGVFVGLIVGGALGNVLDRLFRGGGGGGSKGFMGGAVIDFIDFQFWPVFNVADSAIVVGAILMVLAGAKGPNQ